MLHILKYEIKHEIELETGPIPIPPFLHHFSDPIEIELTNAYKDQNNID